MSDSSTVKIECTECPYSQLVHPEDDALPAEVIVEHGRETGHKLTTANVHEETNDASP